MPVAGGPFIQKTGILLEVDAANAASYPGTGTTWTNLFRPGTYNGTINGTVGFNSTDAYGALTFPGTGSTYVDFGNIGDLSVSWSFQVAVKPSPSASGNYTILSYTSGSGTGSITFKLDYSSSIQSATLSSYSATGSTQIVHRLTGSVSTGSWSIINASYGSTVLGMFVNGRPTDYAVTTGSTVGYNANNRLYLGGTFGTTSSFYTGSVASFFSYNSDIPNAQLIQNYNAYATRFGLPPSNLFPYATDPDAFRFIEIANITNSTQAAAVNTLVVGLKSYGLWDKMQVIYPFVGGTAFSHKWNLKNPADTDAAFRIQYVGALSHTATGVQTAGGYLNPNFRSTNINEPTSSFHYSAYTYTTASNAHNIVLEIQSLDGISFSPQYGYSPSSNPQYSVLQNNGDPSGAGLGYRIASRLDTSLSTLYGYLNTGNFTGTNSTTFKSVNQTNTIRILGTYNFTPYNGIINFVTFGAGLTSQESANLNTVVRNFNLALSRNVV